MNIILSTDTLLKFINVLYVHTQQKLYAVAHYCSCCIVHTFCVKVWGRYSVNQTTPQKTSSESVTAIPSSYKPFHNILDKHLDSYSLKLSWERISFHPLLNVIIHLTLFPESDISCHHFLAHTYKHYTM